MKIIPLHEPQLNKSEIRNLQACIKSGWISSSGKFLNEFEQKIKKFTRSKAITLTNSGTSALHIALKASGLEKDEEVLVPTITFIATINAIIYNKAAPVFLDIGNDLNISLNKTLSFLENETYKKNGFTFNKRSKKKIRALIIVHVFGNAVDLKKIQKVCKERNIKIIEDAAESLGTYYKKNYLGGKHTGTIGDVGCISFNGNKIISTGGGGAIISNSSSLIKNAKYLSNQAKDNKVFFIHNEVGYNYSLSNIHAAIGCAQFNKLKGHLLKKKQIHIIYEKLFNKFRSKITLIKTNFFCTSNYWLNVIKIKNLNKINQKKIISKLQQKKITLRPIWLPNHRQKQFKKYQKYEISNADIAVNTHLCLPSSPNLKRSDQEKIVKLIINS